jgi:hypothetical protein
MSSENKKRKTDRRLHWGRGSTYFLKGFHKIKGLSFFHKRDRSIQKKVLEYDIKHHIEMKVIDNEAISKCGVDEWDD